MPTLSRPLRPGAIAIIALAAALLAPAASAQPQPESALPEGSTAEDVAAREKFNQQQAEFARRQLAQNAANQAEYERKLAEVEAARARIAADDAAARAAYEAELARVEAEKARIDAEHRAAMARWEADVAACKAGDFQRCSGT